MIVLIALLAGFGHFSICIALINRVHGNNIPRPLLKLFDLAWCALFLGIPILIGIWYLHNVVHGQAFSWSGQGNRLVATYLLLSCASALVAATYRIWWIAKQEKLEQLVSNHTHIVSVAEQLNTCPAGDVMTRWMAKIPGNEIFDLSIHEKVIRLPRLDPALDGLTITHLSDLHFTGQLRQVFFDEVIRQCNLLDSDVVVITGDIIDKRECLPWLTETLGQIKSRLGSYFILGNHDKRIKDSPLVRGMLRDAGLTDLGSNWLMEMWRDRPVILAGNELPWYPPAADMESCPESHHGHRPLRILLSHSPDQLRFARRNDVDLMLSGHTHGGQVRFPIIGPILAPSLNGIRHASGTFYHHPTLLHVSRGVSGTRTLRINCPPEIAKLVLRAGEESLPSGL